MQETFAKGIHSVSIEHSFCSKHNTAGDPEGHVAAPLWLDLRVQSVSRCMSELPGTSGSSQEVRTLQNKSVFFRAASL